MAAMLNGESEIQFLARMLLSTREGHQIPSRDAQRLGNLAKFGQHGPPTTMPEERRDGSKPLEPITKDQLVSS